MKKEKHANPDDVSANVLVSGMDTNSNKAKKIFCAPLMAVKEEAEKISGLKLCNACHNKDKAEKVWKH